MVDGEEVMDVSVCIDMWQKMAEMVLELRDECKAQHPQCKGAIACPCDLMLGIGVQVEKSHKF